MLGVAIATFASQSFAQVLWQKASYGMTLDQVQSTIPETIPPRSPDSLDGGREVELLSIPSVSLVNTSFVAHFFFADAKLTQVTLSAPRDIPDVSADLLYESVLTALRSKYGSEVNSEKPRSIGTMSVRKAEFMSGRTNIDLYMMHLSGTAPILSVVYQVRIAADADKL